MKASTAIILTVVCRVAADPQKHSPDDTVIELSFISESPLLRGMRTSGNQLKLQASRHGRMLRSPLIRLFRESAGKIEDQSDRQPGQDQIMRIHTLSTCKAASDRLLRPKSVMTRTVFGVPLDVLAMRLGQNECFRAHRNLRSQSPS